MPYIEVIREDRAEGKLREVYDEIIAQRGALSEVLMIQSLNPESIRRHVDLYMITMFGKSPLRRWQREMIAVVVSKNNECPYCVAHHTTALGHFWKDDARIEKFCADYRSVGLSELEVKLCEYAEVMTRTPSKMTAEFTDGMKAAGVTDRMLHDTALIVSYFNFVNRMVLGLGVELEEHKGAGYEYD